MPPSKTLLITARPRSEVASVEHEFKLVVITAPVPKTSAMAMIYFFIFNFFNLVKYCTKGKDNCVFNKNLQQYYAISEILFFKAPVNF